MRALFAALMLAGCAPEPAPEGARDGVERAERKRRRAPAPLAEGDLDRAFAALGAQVGRGFVACELGMAPAGAVVVEGLERVELEGSVLRALVDGESGAAALAPEAGEGGFPEPVAVLAWTGAAAGARGRCVVGPPKFRDTRVVLTDEAGQPLGRDRVVALAGCWGLDEPTWDGAGGLRMRSLEGVLCRPWVQVDGVDHLPSFAGGAPRAELALGPATRGAPTPRDGLPPAAIDAALASAGLSDGARAVLVRWAEATPRSVEQALGALAPR